MSDLFDEEVIPMPPVSVAMLEEIADAVLALVAPDHLVVPRSLDLLHLAEHVLPGHGIHVEAASAAEMGHREGLTDPVSDGRNINILIVESLWRELILTPSNAVRARATILHELGHAASRSRDPQADTDAPGGAKRAAGAPHAARAEGV